MAFPRIIAPFWCENRDNHPQLLFEEIRYTCSLSLNVVRVCLIFRVFLFLFYDNSFLHLGGIFTTSFPGSLILPPPGASEERPWLGLVTCHFDNWTHQRGVLHSQAIGTLSNRRRWPDDGNQKRDISFQTSLRMYSTLWPDVALKLKTWEHGVSRRDENLSTSCFCFDPFSVLLCYFRAEPR